MATAHQLINRALRLCGVMDVSDAAAGSDAQDALDTLNALLAEWHEAGIGLPDYTIATLDAELASDDADRDAIAYQLAIRVAPEYGKELPPSILGQAALTMFRLRSRYFQAQHPVVGSYF